MRMPILCDVFEALKRQQQQQMAFVVTRNQSDPANLWKPTSQPTRKFIFPSMSEPITVPRRAVRTRETVQWANSFGSLERKRRRDAIHESRVANAFN